MFAKWSEMKSTTQVPTINWRSSIFSFLLPSLSFNVKGLSNWWSSNKIYNIVIKQFSGSCCQECWWFQPNSLSVWVLVCLPGVYSIDLFWPTFLRVFQFYFNPYTALLEPLRSFFFSQLQALHHLASSTELYLTSLCSFTVNSITWWPDKEWNNDKMKGKRKEEKG